MTRQTRRRFSPEYKEQAVARLSAPGATRASVAAELGVTPTQLKTWRLELEGRELGLRRRGLKYSLSPNIHRALIIGSCRVDKLDPQTRISMENIMVTPHNGHIAPRVAARPKPGSASRLRFAALTLLASLFSAELRAQMPPSPEAGWRFSVTPYVWAPSIEGDFRYSLPGGTSGATVGIDTINLLEALNFAAMIAAEARHGRFSILTDFIYLDLGKASSAVRSVDFVQVGPNPISTSLNAGTESSIRGSLWTLGGGYTLADGGWGHVDAFTGLRWFSLETRTDVRLATDIVAPGGGRSFARTAGLARNTDLFDGIFGLRGRFILGSGFHLPYAFDIGAGSSRLTWQAAGGVGYQTGWAGVTLGYRHLYYDQSGDQLVQDFSFSGPFFAANFNF